MIEQAHFRFYQGMSVTPELRAKIWRALKAGAKPLAVARKFRVPLLTIAAIIAELSRNADGTWL